MVLSEAPSLVRDFAASLERFARAHLDPSAIDEQGRIPTEVVRGLGELGAFGVSIPQAYGGAGLGLAEVSEVVATLAKRDRSVAATLGLHLGLGTRGLVAFGSEELKARYLPSIASGQALTAFATTEAGAGSDLGAIRTQAHRDGEGLIVNGEKIYVTNGGIANLITITATSSDLGGGRRGHSLILLESTDPGLEIGPEEHKLGLRGSSTTGLRFNEIRIPLDRVIGRPGEGSTHLEHVLAWGRTAMAAGCVGAGREGLERVVEHVTTRVQFGRPIGELPVVRNQVATLAAVLFATEALVAEAAETDDDHRLSRLSMATKIFASEANGEIADEAVQLFGGSGFIEDTGVPLLLRDARITRVFEGANDVLATRLGVMEVTHPSHRPASGERRADALAEDIERALVEAKKRLGIHILRHSAELHRFGRLAVLREATDAAVRRARRTIGDGRVRASASSRCLKWQLLAEDRARTWLSGGPDPDLVQAVTRNLYEEAGR